MTEKFVIQEPAKSTPIKEKTQVLIIGAGPAGVAAAVSAARLGAEVIITERFHQVGGMATGGKVLLFDDMTDGSHKTVGGITEEILRELIKNKGAVVPPANEINISNEEIWHRWRNWGFENFHSNTSPNKINYCASVDPESLSFALLKLIEQNGIKLNIGSLFCEPVMDAGIIKGGIFEAKSGRHAIFADIVIDASGDGDVFSRAGASYTQSNYILTLVHRLGNVNTDLTEEWEKTYPQESNRINKNILDIHGGYWHGWWLKTPIPGVVWCNCPHFPRMNGIDEADLSQVLVEGTKRIQQSLGYIREHVPGFENAVLIDVASQIGVRQTRLLKGEYILTQEDIKSGRKFTDRIGRGRDYYYPYGCLLPREVQNLIIAGRCFSATPEAQVVSREIPPMFVLGQAAGTAAALSIKTKKAIRTLDIKLLQDSLTSQGVILD